jgi:murein DD-endopeptidase MepM/ murein hydrolase activator NlpD
MGMAYQINRLKNDVLYRETRILSYSDQLSESENIIMELKDEINDYAKKLQTVMTDIHSLEQRTSLVAEDNNHIIQKVGHLLGLESNDFKSIYENSSLSSRSGHRPKLDTKDTSFQRNYVLTVDRSTTAERILSTAQQSNAQLMDKITDREDFLMAYPSILPVEGRISCTMGERPNPFGRRRMEYHNGIDIAVDRGTDVKATGKGKVVFAGYKGSYGNLVIIDHGFDIKTYYAHNSKLLVEEGDVVERGDIIAKSGNSGRSTGPHVHYEIRIKNVPKDPLDFVLNFDKEDE